MIERTLEVSEADVAKRMGITVTKLRSIACQGEEELMNDLYAKATRLKSIGLSNVEISKNMFINESSIRTILNKPLL